MINKKLLKELCISHKKIFLKQNKRKNKIIYFDFLVFYYYYLKNC
jgi:hypothetical protein